ncbi:hypothetical protein L1856_04810 [Streptomyces sp. Tue 6430]|nr:hypothetical protein [Streptomyces sp. Tue 6430]
MNTLSRVPSRDHLRSRLQTPRRSPYFSGRWTRCDPVWDFRAIASIAHPGAGLGYSGSRSRSVSGYGDETLAFDTTQVIDSGGPSIPVTVLVVRQDSTIATFLSLNPVQPPTIPQDIVDAQLRKLA